VSSISSQPSIRASQPCHSRTEPPAVVKNRGRSAASENAEKLLQRLNAELSADAPPFSSSSSNSGNSSSGSGSRSSGLRPMNLALPYASSTTTRLPNSVSQFRNDFREEYDHTTSSRTPPFNPGYSVTEASSITGYSSNSAEGNIDVSAMDEDEQLAWALAQSML
jgi:hypothetical protein